MDYVSVMRGGLNMNEKRRTDFQKEFLLLIICDFSEFVSFFEELHNISLIYE